MAEVPGLALVQRIHRERFERRALLADADRDHYLDLLVLALNARGRGAEGVWGRTSEGGPAGPISRRAIAYWFGATRLPPAPREGPIGVVWVISDAGDPTWQPVNDRGEGSDAFGLWLPVASVQPAVPRAPGPDAADRVAPPIRLEELERLAVQIDEVLTAQDQLYSLIVALELRLLNIRAFAPRVAAKG